MSDPVLLSVQWHHFLLFFCFLYSAVSRQAPRQAPEPCREECNWSWWKGRWQHCWWCRGPHGAQQHWDFSHAWPPPSARGHAPFFSHLHSRGDPPWAGHRGGARKHTARGGWGWRKGRTRGDKQRRGRECWGGLHVRGGNTVKRQEVTCSLVSSDGRQLGKGQLDEQQFSTAATWCHDDSVQISNFGVPTTGQMKRECVSVCTCVCMLWWFMHTGLSWLI